jgi:hypothetical protein
MRRVTDIDYELLQLIKERIKIDIGHCDIVRKNFI